MAAARITENVWPTPCPASPSEEDGLVATSGG